LGRLRFRTIHFVVVGLLCPLLGYGASVHAATVLIAGGDASIDGNYNSGYPFNTSRFRGGSMRYQQVYAAGEFAALDGPQYLTTIAFRADDAYGSAFTATTLDIRVDLSTTPHGADNLSPTFADNIGPDRRTVFDGLLTLSSSATRLTSGARLFDVLLTLTDPFLFDPARGNLLLDIRSYGTTSTTQMDSVLTRADGLSRVMSRNAQATSGYADTSGLVTQFTFQPQPVPLPPAIWLLAAPLLALAGFRRRGGRH
jgi:hypothetical protein